MLPKNCDSVKELYTLTRHIQYDIDYFPYLVEISDALAKRERSYRPSFRKPHLLTKSNTTKGGIRCARALKEFVRRSQYMERLESKAICLESQLLIIFASAKQSWHHTKFDAIDPKRSYQYPTCENAIAAHK